MSRKSADRKLVDAYFAAIRANTVTRSCMCCKAKFDTDQAYRLCPECRSVEIVSCIPEPLRMDV